MSAISTARSLLAAVLVIAGGACSGSDQQNSHSEEAASGPVDILLRRLAFSSCQQFVEQRLKAPKTAAFASFRAPGVVVASLGGGEFEVLSYVDAENSFSAMLRNHYVCVVRHTSGDDFELLRLDFDSKVREADRRAAEEARRLQEEAARERQREEAKRERERQQAARERRRQEAVEQERQAAVEREEAERRLEEHRQAVLERDRREKALREQRAALMPAWHPIYLRELAALRPAIGAVTEAWSRGDQGLEQCGSLRAALANVDRDQLLDAPEPAVASRLGRMLGFFDHGARLCATGQRYRAEEEIKAAAREWGELAEILRRHGLQP